MGFFRGRFLDFFVLLVLVALAALLVYLYREYNPLENARFPKCSFYRITGWQCPGCGGQRSLHYLLNGELVLSFRMNPLLHVAVWYLALVGVLRIGWLRQRFDGWYERLTGLWACVAWLGAIFAFWILRNIF